MKAAPTDIAGLTAYTLTRLRRIAPKLSIEPGGPGRIIVEGRGLDLENLRRMVAGEPDRGGDIVEHYLEQLFGKNAEESHLRNMDWPAAAVALKARVQPESIFNSGLARDSVAHLPFVNGTVIVYVLDSEAMTVSVTTEQMKGWGRTLDDLDAHARANLGALPFEPQYVHSSEGGLAALVSHQDAFDAARLLRPDLRERLAHRMGPSFYVAIPARDVCLALTPEPSGFVPRMRERVVADHARLAYPITARLFLVTPDGIAPDPLDPL